MNKKLKWLFISVALISGIGLILLKNPSKSLITNTYSKMGLIITSPYFKNGGMIPPQFTCDGADTFPDLFIKNLPKETKSLAISVEDPDAPFKTFIHLIAFAPFATDQITQEVLAQSLLGVNDFGSLGRRGPCPPPGDKPHRYFFKVLALGDVPSIPPSFEYSHFVQLLQNLPVLNSGELVGIYSRKPH